MDATLLGTGYPQVSTERHGPRHAGRAMVGEDLLRLDLDTRLAAPAGDLIGLA
jgi:hypothetical protein